MYMCTSTSPACGAAPALALGAGESARPFYLHHLSISRDAPGAPALRAGGCPVPPWRRMRAVERTGLDICTTAGAQQPRRCFFLIEWNEHTGKRRCTRAPRAPRLAGRVRGMLRYGLLTSFRLEISTPQFMKMLCGRTFERLKFTVKTREPFQCGGNTI